jgi:multiple sugar transport system substrate-binding protein
MATEVQGPQQQARSLSRRQFLQRLVGGAGLAVITPLVAACAGANPAVEAPTTATVDAAATAPPVAPAVQNGTTTLVLMYNDAEFSNDEIKAFTDTNPNIKIERVAPDDARFTSMLAAGTPPDAFRTEGRFIPSLANQRVVLDLSDYFKASSTIKLDDLAPPISYYTYEGTIYGMAKDWSPDHSMYVYNTAFEEAGLPVPRTTAPLRYANIATLAKQLTKQEGDRTLQIGWAYENSWFVRTIQRILAEEDQHIYKADFSAIVLKNNPLAIEALQYFYDRSKENVTWNPLNPSPAGLGNDFAKGMIGMVSYGYWYSGFLASQKDLVVKDKITFIPAPTWGGKKRVNPSVSAAGTAIARATKSPDAAWKLFEYYNAGRPALARAKSGWGVPALRSLYPLMPRESPFQQQVQTVLQDELQYSDVLLDVNPYYKDSVFNDSWATNLEQALRGSINFVQLVDRIEHDVNAAINEGRARLGM